MLHPILVPLDGSRLAEQALPYAETLARAIGVPLLLVEAAAVIPRTREGAHDARLRACDEAQAHLEALAGDLAARALPAEVVVELASPAQVIEETAKARQAQLIVMTTHGWGGGSPWVLGGVAEHVLRRSRAPVLFLSPVALTAGNAQRLHGPVVVPTDGSALSENIYPVVQGLLRHIAVPVTLLRVIDPVSYYTAAAMVPFGPMIPPTLVDEAVTAAQANLDAEADRWRQRGINTVALARSGSPSEVITTVATEQQAGWIALASHGRGGFGGFVLGSTALRVVRHAPLPVLIAVGRPAEPSETEAVGR
jgi:nucleotide-binding universal stress UspA family protein